MSSTSKIVNDEFFSIFTIHTEKDLIDNPITRIPPNKVVQVGCLFRLVKILVFVDIPIIACIASKLLWDSILIGIGISIVIEILFFWFFMNTLFKHFRLRY
jgi:hypothetical protein